MGKIGRRMVYTVHSTHADGEHRYVVLQGQQFKNLSGATSRLANEVVYFLDDDEPFPTLCDIIVFVGGPGLDGCIAKAGEDEPLFTLRATDELAPDVVRDWVVRMLFAHGVTSPRWDHNGLRDPDDIRRIRQAVEVLDEGKLRDKLTEALDQADEMERWPVRSVPGL